MANSLLSSEESNDTRKQWQQSQAQGDGPHSYSQFTANQQQLNKNNGQIKLKDSPSFTEPIEFKIDIRREQMSPLITRAKVIDENRNFR